MRTIHTITDSELVTAHRNQLVTSAEYVDEAIRRGWPEWRISLIAMVNFQLRQQGDEYNVH